MDVDSLEKAYFDNCRSGIDEGGILAAASCSDLSEMRDSQEVTLLMVACMNGNLEIVQLLTSKGVSVTEKDELGRSPLHTAITGRKSVYFPRDLIRTDEVTKKRAAYLSPSVHSDHSKYRAIVDILLGYNQVSINDRLQESHPMNLAIDALAHPTLLGDILQSSDLSLNWKDCRSAMEEAVKFDSVQHLEIMLGTGNPLFNPNYILLNQFSLLGLAVRRISNRCTLALLNHDSIDPKCCGEGECRPEEINPVLLCLNGDTDTLEQKNARKEQLSLLLAHPKLSVNGTPSPNGEAPVHRAVLLDDPFFLKLLLEHPDVDLNSKSGGEFCPLKFCILLEHHVHTSLILRDPRVIVNVTKEEMLEQQQDANRLAALPILMEALLNGTARIVEMFLAAGADPNRTHWYGDWGILDAYAFNLTQVCEARTNRDFQKLVTIARLLLENGSRPSISKELVDRVLAQGPTQDRVRKKFKATVEELRKISTEKVQTLNVLTRNAIQEQLRGICGKRSTVQAMNNLVRDEELPVVLKKFLRYENLLEENV